MADVTLGFKVSEEVKDRAKQMIEASGMSAKDWIQSAITMYESKNVGTAAPEFVTSLHELEVHTTRIHELAVHMVQQSMHLKDQAVREAYQEADRKDEIVADYQEKLREVKQQLQTVQEENAALRDAYEQASTQMTDIKQARDTQQALVQELQQKVEALTDQAMAYETAKQQIVETKEAHKTALEQQEQQYEQQLLAEKTHITTITEQYEEKLTTLTAELAARDKDVQQLRHAQALAEKESDLTLQQALMQQEQQFQQKLQQQMDAYHEKLFQLMTANQSTKKEVD